METETQLNILPKKSKVKLVVVVFAILVLIAGSGTGAYFWQHKKVNALDGRISRLQNELKTSSDSVTTTQKQQITSTTFTYSPKTGGLSLTLPKIYGIIVNVDGNKGGAPGATFRVGTLTTNNMLTDNVYEGVQVDIDGGFGTPDLNTSATSVENQTKSDGFDGIKIGDATVAGLPAKLITAQGVSYAGNQTKYVVVSGGFVYTISAHSPQTGSFDMLTAVVKGLKLKPVTL